RRRGCCRAGRASAPASGSRSTRPPSAAPHRRARRRSRSSSRSRHRARGRSARASGRRGSTARSRRGATRPGRARSGARNAGGRVRRSLRRGRDSRSGAPPMRIAYVCYWDARRRDGVGEKIESQLAAWRRLGHEAELFVLTPAGPKLRLGGRAFPFEGLAARVRATRRLDAAVRADRPDVVYLRYDLFLPPPLRAVGAGPAVVEVNSDTGAELRARSRPAAAYERLQRPFVLGRAAGAVCVTGELADALRRERPSLPVE